jgi:hypothetical protein
MRLRCQRGQDLWKARNLSSRINVGDAEHMHDQLDLALSGFFISVQGLTKAIR